MATESPVKASGAGDRKETTSPILGASGLGDRPGCLFEPRVLPLEASIGCFSSQMFGGSPAPISWKNMAVISSKGLPCGANRVCVRLASHGLNFSEG